MAEVKKVMISSTARDLPAHRKAVEEACLRMGMFPVMMESLPAMTADAVKASLSMVDDADIYLGIFAYRYGYVPDGADVSVTEMEYDRALEKAKPRLIFFMHEEHPVKPADVETGPGAEKLKKFKERVGKKDVANFFKSSDELRAQAIHSLGELRDRPATESFHYIHDIPKPPEVYVAHPYTLLQTKDVVGRQAELNLLTDWVAKPSSDVYKARILNIVALGGMGKSALTWKWFNNTAPHEMKPLAGRMWWSFYESDATFENFIIRALAYVSRQPCEAITKIPIIEREGQLLAALNAEPYLIVLDGLERILIAYSGHTAAWLLDDDELDKQTANRVAGAIGLSQDTAALVVGRHRLRQCTDARAGVFLRKMAAARSSRILITTRLYPSELQSESGRPVAGCHARFLVGLNDDDALDLWRAYGVSGSRDELLRLFRTFDNYPLLIRALAGEVAGYRRAPGDFDAWRGAHRNFAPYDLALKNDRRSHVLEYALRNLTTPEREVMRVVAAFRMPTKYDTLAALRVGTGVNGSDSLTTEAELDVVLTLLEDRGLLGWDQRANRYDVHPVVRGVVWNTLSDGEKTDVYTTLHSHFEAIPPINMNDVNAFEDLTPIVEQFHILMALKRYQDAFNLFRDRLEDATLYRLGVSRRRAELLEMFFPDGFDKPPCLASAWQYSWVLNSLALAYDLQGEPCRSIPLYEQKIEMDRFTNNVTELSVGLRNIADANQVTGALFAAETAAIEALLISRQNGDSFRSYISSCILGSIQTSCGRLSDARNSLLGALSGFRGTGEIQFEGVVMSFLTEYSIWLDHFSEANLNAENAWHLAHEHRLEGDFIRASRLQGAAALGIGNYVAADERLHHSLRRARAVNLVREELPILAALSDLRRRQRNLSASRELLDDVWELAERGPFPLFHADARNVLAKVERDAGNHDAAVEAATRAYELAWCDGPPYAYHWGLEAAKGLLAELGAPEPEMPPFDPSKYPPMPEVEIKPVEEVAG